jgi:hypothetical protein
MIEDGFWLVFLFRQQILVPTMARTKAGYYMGIEPVEVVDSHNQQAIEQAIIRTVKRGNPSVPTPPGGTKFTKSLLLKYTKMKSISSFDKIAKSWKFAKRDGAFLIVPYRPRIDRGQEEDTERGEAIPAGVPLETAVHRLIQRVLET